jgi:hypothetical protein
MLPKSLDFILARKCPTSVPIIPMDVMAALVASPL